MFLSKLNCLLSNQSQTLIEWVKQDDAGHKTLHKKQIFPTVSRLTQNLVVGPRL